MTHNLYRGLRWGQRLALSRGDAASARIYARQAEALRYAWENRGKARDGKRSRWYDPDTKKTRTQISQPGSRKNAPPKPQKPVKPPRPDPGSVASKLHGLNRADVTPEVAKELTTHLMAMRKADMHQVREALGIDAKGLKSAVKGKLAGAIIDHVRGLSKPAKGVTVPKPLKAKPGSPKPPPEPTAREASEPDEPAAPEESPKESPKASPAAALQKKASSGELAGPELEKAILGLKLPDLLRSDPKAFAALAEEVGADVGGKQGLAAAREVFRAIKGGGKKPAAKDATPKPKDAGPAITREDRVAFHDLVGKSAFRPGDDDAPAAGRIDKSAAQELYGMVRTLETGDSIPLKDVLRLAAEKSGPRNYPDAKTHAVANEIAAKALEAVDDAELKDPEKVRALPAYRTPPGSLTGGTYPAALADAAPAYAAFLRERLGAKPDTPPVTRYQKVASPDTTNGDSPSSARVEAVFALLAGAETDAEYAEAMVHARRIAGMTDDEIEALDGGTHAGRTS